jgi:hypothetical protein
VPWKPWLTACVSLLLAACATAPEPPLTASLVVGAPKLKRALELAGRDYAVTVTRVGMDGEPAVTRSSGTLDTEEYRRLCAHFDALDLAAFKELYAGRDLDRTGRTTMVRVAYKGVTRTVTIIGPTPPEAEPLLAPLLPFLDRVP